LEAANARISSLEPELEASRKAWDAATASKDTAEKSTKLALARANKAEKALSDANKEHIQLEQAVIEWLNKMSALAGGEYLFPSSLGYDTSQTYLYFLMPHACFYTTCPMFLYTSCASFLFSAVFVFQK
jgi:hypothetical protein